MPENSRLIDQTVKAMIKYFNINTDGFEEYNLARDFLAEIGLNEEWLIVQEADEFPYGATTWTEKEARDAAIYRSERWGPTAPVRRFVSEWEKQ